MGSDDLFKKRRKEREKRRHEYKNPKANSYLIVTEGSRTEPLYFKGLRDQIKDQIGGMVEVVEVPVIDVCGEGCATGKLIEAAEKIIKDANIIYQNIWVVFDKDDFVDFDQAIQEAAAKGIKVAWSNQSFEYWLYLHFNYSDSALHRNDWCEKLDKLFKEFHLSMDGYQKNDEDIYKKLDSIDGVNTAIKNAKRRMEEFESETDKLSAYDPGTTVHMLVMELKDFLNEK